MKALVVYDSKFGNTEQLARAIADQLGSEEAAPVVAAVDASGRDLAEIDLLIVGGPTQAHGVSTPLRDFIGRIPTEAVRDLPIATFDTRLHWPRALSGSAAVGSAGRLTKKGARMLLPAESFIVNASEGPLADGEIDRATAWAKSVRAKYAELKEGTAVPA